MSLRWRIAIGFALVALGTAAVIALATPPIVTQGFSDVDDDSRPSSSAVIPDDTLELATDTPENASATPEHATATARTPTETEDAGTPASASASAWAESSSEPSAETSGEPSERENLTPALIGAAPAPTATVTPRPAGNAPITTAEAERTTIMRLLLAAAGAVIVASLLGLWGAGRLVRPLTRLEQAAAAVARGDLSRRSGVSDRSDEFGQLGRTFDSMASQLQLADETRRRFLQDAAHELKTPLAVIDATSSAILDGVYTPEQRHMETIRDQSRILARIVDDLRTISLAEGGHLPLERRPLDVRAVLDSVAAGFEARAAASSIKLSADGATGIVVEADPERLRQIIGALVDNALRHTPSGGSVRLAASAAMAPGPALAGKIAPARPIVRITVDDSGPGIPPDSLASIFERFYQADTSRSRGSGTSGLGLSIVRALAEAHGGHAGAENRPEGGARLWIELPALRFT
jgi:two-component system sensor histidine kinase BaeS